MGVLSDLVMAGARDAGKVLAAENPAKTFAGIDVKGIDTVKLDALRALLGEKAGDEDLGEPAAIADAGERLVFRIPPAFVAGLAALSAAERAKTAKAWAKAEEFALDRWKPADVARALDAICALAAKAVEAKKAVFLWMCV